MEYPRRGRDPSPRTIRVAAAASPRLFVFRLSPNEADRYQRSRRFDDESSFLTKENALPGAESCQSLSDYSDGGLDDATLFAESIDARSFASAAPPRPRGVCLVPQQYETPLYPCGCIFKFVLLSTHGDPFYVGLTGVELADADGTLLDIDAENVHAEPRDVNCLPENSDRPRDTRTLDKLVDGVADAADGAHCWLAPFVGGTNAIFVCFDAQAARASLLKRRSRRSAPGRGGAAT